MNTFDLETFKQLVNIKNGMNEIIIEDVYYHQRLNRIYKDLDKLIMDIVMGELGG